MTVELGMEIIVSCSQDAWQSLTLSILFEIYENRESPAAGSRWKGPAHHQTKSILLLVRHLVNLIIFFFLKYRPSWQIQIPLFTQLHSAFCSSTCVSIYQYVFVSDCLFAPQELSPVKASPPGLRPPLQTASIGNPLNMCGPLVLGEQCVFTIILSVWPY